MIAFLIAQAARIGIPDRFRKAASYAVLAATVLAGIWLAKTLYDRSVVQHYEAEKTAKTIEARDDAADQRAADAIADTQNEKDRIDAIESASPGGLVAPASRALNCERLRKLGRVPPACGS